MADLPAQLDWRRILPETAPPEPPDAELFLLAVAVELDRCWPEPADALRDRVRTHADLVVRAIFWWQSRRYDRLLDHVDFQPWTTRPERSAVDIVLRWLDREPADFHDLAGLDDLLRMALRRHAPGPAGRRPWLRPSHWWWSYPEASAPAGVSVEAWVAFATRIDDASRVSIGAWLWELHRLLRDQPGARPVLKGAVQAHADAFRPLLRGFVSYLEDLVEQTEPWRAEAVVWEHLDHLAELQALGGGDPLLPAPDLDRIRDLLR